MAEAPTVERSDVEDLELVRPLVPSEREVDAGEAPDYVFVPEPVRPPEPGAIKRITRGLQGYAVSLDPRTLTRSASMVPLLTLAILAFVDKADSEGFGILLPDLRDTFNVNVNFLIGVLFATVSLAFFAAPFVGFYVDRVKRVRLLRLAMLARFGLAGVVAAQFGSLVPFVTARLTGAAVGGALGLPVKQPLLADTYRPSVITRVFAFGSVFENSGGVAGPLLAAVLDIQFGARGALLAFGLVGLLFAVPLFVFVREPKRGEMLRLELAERGLPMPPDPPPLKFGETFRALRGIQSMWRVWFAMPFLGACAFTVSIYLAVFLVEVYNLGPLQRAYYITAGQVGAIVVTLVFAANADRIFGSHPERVPRLIAAMLVLEAASVPLISWSPTPLVTAIAAVVPLAAQSIFFPAVLSLVTRIVPPRLAGSGVGSALFFLPFGLYTVYPLVFVLGYQVGFRAGILALIPIALGAAAFMLSISPFIVKDMAAAQANVTAEEEARRARESGRNKMLICRAVEVYHGAAQVLFGIDFDVEEGQIVALLGTNGAGKSTLLRAVAAVHGATYGAIFLDGVDVTHSTPQIMAERGVVMMPGGHAIFPTMTAAENLRAAAWLYKHDEAYVKERTNEVLELFPRLRDRLSTQAGNLSGGEQQMLALGQALIMKPRLLMIDELSLGLAPQVVEQLLEVVRKIHAQGTTIIIVEQSINVALSIAERAVYMENGLVRFDGPVRDLVRRSDLVRSVFLGQAATRDLTATHERAVRDDEEHRPILEVKDLTLQYGGLRVLDGVDLAIGEGEVVGIVGPNGAGKTSLFDVLSGFAAPTSGAIVFDGSDITKSGPDARGRMGLARSYQNVRLFPALTVRENIAVALERHLQNRSALLAAVWSPITRRVERRVERRVDNLIESLGLGPMADKFMNELSTGTRRIVDIACQLGTNPRLLLLDEPTSGLAQAETEQLAPVIDRIVKETGCAMVIIEHDLGLIAAVSRRLVAMRLGQIFAEGNPREVLNNQEVIDTLLGGASAAVLSRTIQLEASGQLAGGNT